MPHFVNLSQKMIISTNYKVMYSTLKRQKAYRKAKRWMIATLPFKKYALVRNPYDRLESFYFDKLHKTLDDSDYFVRSQRIFFPVLNLEKATSAEKYKALKGVDFDKFIELLPQIYNKNRHLHPQYWMFKGQNYRRFLKIESADDQLFMLDHLGLDLSIKANETKKEKTDWKENCLAVVNEIYSEDFNLFNYQKIRDSES